MSYNGMLRRAAIAIYRYALAEDEYLTVADGIVLPVIGVFWLDGIIVLDGIVRCEDD